MKGNKEEKKQWKKIVEIAKQEARKRAYEQQKTYPYSQLIREALAEYLHLKGNK